jgi:hypothetical protein
LVAASQVIVIALPLTARSRELLDAATLGRARPGAFVVNVGRCSVADEAAVADALERNHLGGGGVEVRDERGDGQGEGAEGDASSLDEGSNGYGSDLRLGGNCRREVDHFRYVLASSSRT